MLSENPILPAVVHTRLCEVSGPANRQRRAAVLAALQMFAALLVVDVARADTSAQTLPFAQNWTNTGLITTNDVWSGVPGIVGYRGDNLTLGTGVDPQTVTSGALSVVDVNANQANPITFATDGVTEFHITNPVVALSGDSTADAPHLILYLNTTGTTNVTITYSLRDLDTSGGSADQEYALQFRVGGGVGPFTNVPAGYVADATTGGVTPVSATLPASANNQSLVEVRIITTNAIGIDEWVGIDDISVTGCPTIAAAGPDATICTSDDVILTGAGTNAAGFLWTTSGDGDFDDETDPTTTYTPGVGDYGQVITLTLTAFGNPQCSDDSDGVLITFPSLDAGPDTLGCPGTAVPLGGSGVLCDSYLWTQETAVGGVAHGTFVDPTDPATSYIASSLDNGTLLYLRLTGAASCGTIEEVKLGYVPNPPVINSQPPDTVAAIGTSTSIHIDATGDPGAMLHYQWRRGATNLANTGHHLGVHSATLTINSVNASDAGTDYNCVLSHASLLHGICPRTVSDDASLNVGAPVARYRTIALSGETPPDGNGTFYIFDHAVLNAGGEAVFWTHLIGTSDPGVDDSGLYRSAPNGTLSLMARKGQPPPDGNGTFIQFGMELGFLPALNGAGEAAFFAFLTDTSGGFTDNNAIYRSAPDGALSLMVRAGQASPGGSGAFGGLGAPALNGAGEAAFRAFLNGTGVVDDNGLYRSAPKGALSLIVRKGQVPPDGNGTFSLLGEPVLNGAGEAAFSASLTGNSGGSATDSGFYRSAPPSAGGALSLMVREGQTLPDGNGTFSNLYSPRLNALGEAAFLAQLTGPAANNLGLYRSAPGGALSLMARKGQTPPEGDGAFISFGQPVLNSAGEAAFFAFLSGSSGGSANDTGLYRSAPTPGGALSVLVREGQAAPDGNGTFSGFGAPVLNGAGDAAFIAFLAGTSGGDSQALYLHDGSSLIQLVRRGQGLEVAPADVRIVSDIILSEQPGSAESGRGVINDDGTVTFMISFTDGSQGIFAAQPEPPCPADLNSSGSVNVTDLLALIGAWGPNPGHVADLNDDGSVNVTDLLALIVEWGPC